MSRFDDHLDHGITRFMSEHEPPPLGGRGFQKPLFRQHVAVRQHVIRHVVSQRQVMHRRHHVAAESDDAAAVIEPEPVYAAVDVAAEDGVPGYDRYNRYKPLQTVT